MGDQTVLMNISEISPYLTGFCDLKCDYSFYYVSSSSCTIAPTFSNSLNYFYDSNPNGIPQVLYNGIEYVVSVVSIYSSSIHFFDGNLVEAEICIVHKSVSGSGSPLVIFIPITSSSGSIPNDKGTKMISQMITGGIDAISLNDTNQTNIDNVISNISSSISNLDSETSQIEGELPKTNKKRDDRQGININNNEGNIKNDLVNLTTQLKTDYFDNALPVTMGNIIYTLDKVIPVNRQFFSYTDTTQNCYFIVYGTDSAIFVDSTVIQSLQETISPVTTTTNSTYNDNMNLYPLFLNKTGATSLLTNNLSDEIYIDCQPTGSSTEQTNVTTSTSTTTEPKSSSTQFFVYVVFFIFVLIAIYMVFSYITHPDKKSFSMSNIKNPFYN